MNILVAFNPEADSFSTFFNEDVKKKLAQMGNVYFFSKKPTEELIAEKIKGADVLITGWGTPQISGKILKNADKLRYILHTGGSVASIITDEVYDKNITVLSGNEIFAHSVAEGVIAYILSALRHIPRIEEALRCKGEWESLDTPYNHNRSLIGKTVGIVSFGAISRYLIPMLAAFGTKIKLYTRKDISKDYLEKYNIVKTDLNDIFKTCDIVSIQTAYNPNTENMINKSHLSLLKDGALFVNTARSRIVNTADLISELKTKRISAVLDVFDNEPLESESPFIKMENVFLMPHMAGPTVDMRAHITKSLIDCIKNCEAGEEVIYKIGREHAKEMSVH